MTMPQYGTGPWMNALSNDDLLVAEKALHKAFAVIETAQKKLLGRKYDLMRGPAELFMAWDRWSRVSAEVRVRGLQANPVSRKAQ